MDNKNGNSVSKGWKRHMRNTACLRVNKGGEMSAVLMPFSWCVFRNLSRQGQGQLQVLSSKVLQRVELELVHEEFLPLQVWILPSSFQLKSLYSDPLLPLEESLL